MKIVWDEQKRAANLLKHGLDFADIGVEFFTLSEIEGTKLGRLKAVGRSGGIFVALVFKPLGNEAISMISMRPASSKERKSL